MERRVMGRTGVQVPVIGQGTWRMEEDDRHAAVATLRAGLDAGLTHIDTAELYGRGRVEELVAEAIAGRRAQVYLVSKVLPQNASRSGTIEACERSLRRLGTDHLDLYLLHWPGDEPLEDTIAAFEELAAAGKIRAWGVSNFDEHELAAARRIAGDGKIACNQVIYHLKERAIEHAVLPWCEQHGVSVVGYSPFGSGDFPAHGTAGRRVLDEVAARHGASAHQVALRFLTRRPSLFAIPKAAAVAHALDNARAGNLRLAADDMDEIDRAFPLGRLQRGVPTL
jgi:diketogulonate reductase-like aldo/keto reductase